MFYSKLPYLSVIGGDIDPTKAKDYVGDYRALPFRDKTFDAVIIDPPFIIGGSVGGPSTAYSSQYGRDPKPTSVLVDDYVKAALEGLRVASKLVVIKCADMVNSGKFCPIAARIIGRIGEPWDILITVREHTMTHPSWKSVQHFRHNYSYFLVYKL